MNRTLCAAAACLLSAAAAAAGEPSAEQLLPPTAQVYVRWDGVAAHREAYRASTLGAAMDAETGRAVRQLVEQLPAQIGSNLLSQPLLQGKPPGELAAVHADLKKANRFLDVLAERGAVLAVEAQGPRPTLGGVFEAVGGLVKGTGNPEAVLMPDVHAYLVIPDVTPAEADTCMAVARLFERQMPSGVEPRTFHPLPADAKRDNGLSFPGYQTGPVYAGCWREGSHFVVYAGTRKFADAVRGLEANVKAGGVTAHPLFQRCRRDPGFESVARGFVDAGSLVDVAARLGGLAVSGLRPRLDAVGLGNLKAVVFSSGFAGRESRAVWEVDLPGERKGLAKLLAQRPMSPADLPPLPPDCSRFSALRVDFPAVYDGLFAVGEAMALSDDLGLEKVDQNTPAGIARRRAELDRLVTRELGVSLKDDLLPHLGDTLVAFQSPTEGLQVFGQVFAVSVKDAAAVRRAFDRGQRVFELAAGKSPIKVRRKEVAGVDIREYHSRGFGVLVPTYAVVDDWLVMAAYPQPVQGFVLRAKGKLPAWRPDAETGSRLTRLAEGGVAGLQYCRPKSTAHNLCCIGPLMLTSINRFSGRDGEFAPLDIGLIPNGHELGGHLFPNLTATRDDGKTVRIEVNESFSLPLEMVGLEPFAFLVLTSLGL